MFRYFTLIISLFSAFNAFSQTEKQAYKDAVARFRQLYNEEQYQQIFQTFTPAMQKAMPAEKNAGFLKELSAGAGKWTDTEFAGTKSGYTLYKSTFQRGTFSFGIALDPDHLISGFFFRPYTPDTLSIPQRNTTTLGLPFRGSWTVVWGGDTKTQNYHVESRAQKNAFDFVIKDSTGSSHKTTGTRNEDYYAFGKEILSPCDATVVLAVDGIKDNTPGDMNPMYVPGNSVILKTTDNEYLFFAHFKQGTVRVREGDQVKKDQVIGLCGNSGNSSEPHLHFHIQNTENMNSATGVKCYFSNLIVNGAEKKEYSPVQGEKISRRGK